jgi:hypothetical protein
VRERDTNSSISYCQLKPKYEEKWKRKLKPKLRDCKEKYEGWKKMAWHAKEPGKLILSAKIVLDANVPSRGARASSRGSP